MEQYGYIFTLRSSRGLKYFIVEYKPAGKPNLRTGDLPQMAIHKLSQVASQGFLSGHVRATLEGIYELYSITANQDSKTSLDNPNQPMYDIFLLIKELFNMEATTGEMRFFFRGYKKTSQFVHLDEFLKAVGRVYLSHQKKMTEQLATGSKPIGIGNVVAYLNAGLHGRNPFLRRSRLGEEESISFVKQCHSKILERIHSNKPEN